MGITGHCCCFCENGSGGRVYVSNVLALGPWLETDMNINADGLSTIIHAQQNYVLQIGEQYLWSGDRWKSSKDAVKGHDYQYWQVLDFDDSVQPGQPPMINKL